MDARLKACFAPVYAFPFYDIGNDLMCWRYENSLWKMPTTAELHKTGYPNNLAPQYLHVDHELLCKVGWLCENGVKVR